MFIPIKPKGLRTGAKVETPVRPMTREPGALMSRALDSGYPRSGRGHIFPFSAFCSSQALSGLDDANSSGRGDPLYSVY